MASSKKPGYNFFYILSAIFLLAWCIITVQQMHEWGGWLLMLFFISLAVAFRSNKVLKGLSYTVIILAAVSLAMYHPQYFKNIGSFKLSVLIVPLLQIIMFGMGTELSLQDFEKVLRMPKGIIARIAYHYTIMPLIGFAVANLFNFPGEIAAGILLVGWHNRLPEDDKHETKEHKPVLQDVKWKVNYSSLQIFIPCQV